MEIVETLGKVPAEFLNGFLWEFFVLLNQLVEISASAIFKNDPEMVPGFVPVVEL